MASFYRIASEPGGRVLGVIGLDSGPKSRGGGLYLDPEMPTWQAHTLAQYAQASFQLHQMAQMNDEEPDAHPFEMEHEDPMAHWVEGGFGIDGPLEMEFDRGLSPSQYIEKFAAAMGELEDPELTPEQIEKIADMPNFIKARVFGQDEVVDQICELIQARLLDLKEQNKPNGVIMLIGPSGVGKTQLAKAIAEFYEYVFEVESGMQRWDMGEFKAEHTVSRLIGAPPGYIGHETGGELANALIKNPRGVYLLDEIGAAHSDIHTALMAPFDEGYITAYLPDPNAPKVQMTPMGPMPVKPEIKARRVDCRRATFIMTANYGTTDIRIGAPRTGFQEGSYGDKDIEEAAKKGFREQMPPQLRGRVDEVLTVQLLDDLTKRRIAKEKGEIALSAGLRRGVSAKLSDEAVDLLVEQGINTDEGARDLTKTIDRLVNRGVLRRLCLSSKTGQQVMHVIVPSEDGRTLAVEGDPDAAPRKPAAQVLV